MSIEHPEGIEKINAALADLSIAYKSLAKLQSLPAGEEGEELLMTFPLTRGEARMVIDSRVTKLKADLRNLGFNKPVVQVPGGASVDTVGTEQRNPTDSRTA